MTDTNPAQAALDQVSTLLDEAEAKDSLGRRLPDRSWTPYNQRRFLELIAEGESVTYATWALGLSVQSAYAFKRTPRGAAFALGWRAASLLAREGLADKLLERAIRGQTERVTRPDGSEVTRLRYDNRLAMHLLTRLDRQAADASEPDAAAARLIAGDFESYLDLVAADAGPARAGLFLARRADGAQAPADLGPIAALAAADRFLRSGVTTAAEVEVADLDPAQRGDWTGEQWARAEAAGLVALAPPPPPEKTAQHPQPTQSVSDLDPVWEDDDHGWLTDAPPPEDFDGFEEGEYGDEEYARELTEAELEIWLAPIVVEQEERRVAELARWREFLARRAAASGIEGLAVAA